MENYFVLCIRLIGRETSITAPKITYTTAVADDVRYCPKRWNTDIVRQFKCMVSAIEKERRPKTHG